MAGLDYSRNLKTMFFKNKNFNLKKRVFLINLFFLLDVLYISHSKKKSCLL